MKSPFRSIVVTALIFTILPIMPAFAAGLELRTVSTRADMVSGDDALVELTGGDASAKVSLNGKDVTDAFHPSGGTLIGHIEGLKPGKNALEAHSGGQTAKLTLTDYPIAGPIFSGPHQTPFMCQTDAFQIPVTGGTLGKPLDADCSAATRVDYLYKGADGKFNPLPDPKIRPADLVQTKTKDGRTVNFIVRVETGTINRGIYQTAVLHDPISDPAPDPWHRPAGWNGRLIYNFGGGCNAGYHQGTTTLAPILNEGWLGMGYAVATSTLNTWNNDCSDVISPETEMMVREHFIDRYGPLVHTIGIGCSGGAMQVHIIAQNYPGLLDGIIPVCTHPDIISYYTTIISDVALVKHVFDTSKLTWTDEQKNEIAGFANWDPVAISWTKQPKGSPGWIVPNSIEDGHLSGCDRSIPADAIYDPVKNPHGTRCTIYENMVNIFGRDPKTGFVRRPLDNVGVEYGLVAFNRGKISAEQFVRLNEAVGGYDADGNIVPERMVGDPEAIRIAYATGQVMTGGGGLATVPILDVHTYAEAVDHHARGDAFMARARLVAANGDADNQILLTYPGRNIQALPDDVVLKMDEWLDNLSKDPAPLTHAKVVRDKPAGLADACFTPEGKKIVEVATFDGPGECNRMYPPHGTIRTAAGAPIATDILKCNLKPVDAKAYAQPLSAAQLARLKAVFPRGVCDYGRPGVAQKVASAQWLRYGSADAPAPAKRMAGN